MGTIGLFGGAYTGVYAMEILGAMLGVAGGFQFFQIFLPTFCLSFLTTYQYYHSFLITVLLNLYG